MNTIRLSATAARNKFFELLNQVSLGSQFIIERDKKEVAVLASRVSKTDWRGLMKAVKATHGILKNDNFVLSPLRKKGVWKRLGKWDKGLET